MTPRVAALLDQLHTAEQALRQDVSDQAERWGFRVGRRSVRFPPAVRSAHQQLKTPILTFLLSIRPLPLLTVPVIYSVTVPLVILDVWITLYQWACFPIYGVPRVRRRDFLVFDRHRLAYLNAIEKAHCLYCGYANGLIAYAREIAARTEQYFCPIKHARPLTSPHGRYHLFLDYGDAVGYRRDQESLRHGWTLPGDAPSRFETAAAADPAPR